MSQPFWRRVAALIGAMALLLSMAGSASANACDPGRGDTVVDTEVEGTGSVSSDENYEGLHSTLDIPTTIHMEQNNRSYVYIEIMEGASGNYDGMARVGFSMRQDGLWSPYVKITNRGGGTEFDDIDTSVLLTRSQVDGYRLHIDWLSPGLAAEGLEAKLTKSGSPTYGPWTWHTLGFGWSKESQFIHLHFETKNRANQFFGENFAGQRARLFDTTVEYEQQGNNVDWKPSFIVERGGTSGIGYFSPTYDNGGGLSVYDTAGSCS